MRNSSQIREIFPIVNYIKCRLCGTFIIVIDAKGVIWLCLADVLECLDMNIKELQRKIRCSLDVAEYQTWILNNHGEKVQQNLIYIRLEAVGNITTELKTAESYLLWQWLELYGLHIAQYWAVHFGLERVKNKQR